MVPEHKMELTPLGHGAPVFISQRYTLSTAITTLTHATSAPFVHDIVQRTESSKERPDEDLDDPEPGCCSGPWRAKYGGPALLLCAIPYASMVVLAVFNALQAFVLDTHCFEAACLESMEDTTRP